MDTKEKDQILERLFKDNTDSGIPREVEIRLRRHLTTLRERIEASKGTGWLPRIFGWGVALRYVTPAVTLILIGFIGYLMMPGESSSWAYADVVEKLRNAHSMTYTMTARVEGSPDVPIPEEWIFKEPHYLRVSTPVGVYWVINIDEKRGLYVSTHQKWYMVMDLSDASPELLTNSDIVHEIRSLPERADKILSKKEIDGHTVQGFRVTEKGVDKTLWVDLETNDLVRMEGEFVNAPGVSFVIENIQFDIEYGDSFFNLDPPPGFTPPPQKIDFDLSLPDEQDLIDMLDMFTSHHVDGFFPDVFNPAEIYASWTNLVTSGKYKESNTDGMTPLKRAIIFERFFLFIWKLKPESDFHYAGKDVKRGATDTPVFWYKPDGSETYRVIYADLTVRDVVPEDLPPVPARL